MKSLKDRVRAEVDNPGADPLNKSALLKECLNSMELTRDEVIWRKSASKHFLEGEREDKFTRKYFRELISIVDRLSGESYTNQATELERAKRVATLALSEFGLKTEDGKAKYSELAVSMVRDLVISICDAYRLKLSELEPPKKETSQNGRR